MANQFISIAPKGIQRNTPDRSTPDGALLEAINVRLKDGAFRGVGDKDSTGWFAETLFEFDEITYHPALPANTYIVHNISDNKIYKVLFTNGTSIQVTTLVLTLASGEVFDRFSHLGNVLLVFTDIKKYILFWDSISSTYKDLTFLPVPITNIFHDSTVDVNSFKECTEPDPIPDLGFDTDALNLAEYYRTIAIGEAYKDRANNRNDNLFEGFVMVRLAYRLFDGSYIMHTQPLIHHVAYHPDNLPYLYRSSTASGINYNKYARLGVAYNFFNTGAFTIPDFDSLGVVESLDIFCTNPVSAFDYDKPIDKWSFTDPEYVAPFQDKQIKSLITQPLYKVHSVPLSDILHTAIRDGESTAYYTAKAGIVYPDMTREITPNDILPVDNFSHHLLHSECDYQYNSKLHFGNIKSVVSNGFNPMFHAEFVKQTNIIEISPSREYSGYEQDNLYVSDIDDMFLGATKDSYGINISTFKLYQQVWIKTDKGRKVITSEVQKSYVNSFDSVHVPSTFAYYGYYNSLSITEKALVFNPMISYPDYRAYKIRFFYTYGSPIDYKFLADFPLKPLIEQNVAYYLPELNITDGSTGMYYPNKVAFPDDVDAYSEPMPSDNPTDDSVIYDTNRMQVSAIFNVFMWPAEYSYRFGLIHNELIAIQGVQQAMSDSAFGQYPLYVFSLHGIFTIQQGTDVLYASIQPLNNEVLLNRDCIISISGAIIFGTREGLRMISGSQVEELSIDVEGSVNNLLSANPYYIDAISGDRLPVINAYRSSVEFKTYLQSARLFYDTENKEIIVSSTNYLYSYAYSFYSASWYSRTEVFYGSLLVNGRLLGIKMSSEVVDPNTVYTYSLHYFDQEDFTEGLCDYALIQTRPVNLSNSASKNIACLISLCDITCKENEFAVQLVAGSNDLIHWNVVSYNQYNEQISNILNKKVIGNFKYFIFVLAGERNGFIFNQFDVEYKVRFNNKLR